MDRLNNTPCAPLIALDEAAISKDHLSIKQSQTDFHLNHNSEMHAVVVFYMIKMMGMGSCDYFYWLISLHLILSSLKMLR